MFLGALPFLAFNVKARGSSVTQNARLSVSELSHKAAYLKSALDGREATVAFVDLTHSKRDQVARPLAKFALAIIHSADPKISSWRFYPCILLIAGGFFVAPRTTRRWMLFFFVGGLIGWLESALTVNAGGWIHHTVLFWINWYCCAALGAAVLALQAGNSSRIAVLATAAVLGILGTRGEIAAYANLIRFGPWLPWTNADRALAGYLEEHRVKRVIATDWGIAFPVEVESDNRIVVLERSFALNDGQFGSREFAACAWPRCAIVSRPLPIAMFQKAATVLVSSMRIQHMTETAPAIIYDTHGFPSYSVFGVNAAHRPPPQNEPDFAKPGFLLTSAPSAPIASEDGLAEAELCWQAPDARVVEVHVGKPDGPLFARSTGPGRSRTGHWVSDNMQFFLQDVTGAKPLTPENTVGRITISVRFE
jgi:hypothetical protein